MASPCQGLAQSSRRILTARVLQYSNSDRVTFIRHHLEALVKVTIDALNQHSIMILAREDVIIHIQKDDNSLKDAEESTGFVNDECVTEAEAKKDTHKRSNKTLGIFGFDGLNN